LIIGVQEYWKAFENKLINIVDEISPLVFLSKKSKTKQTPKTNKKNQNISQRLFLKCKHNPNQALETQIESLDATIITHYRSKKRLFSWGVIIPGETKSFWTTVNKAKDISNEVIPSTLYNKGAEIQPSKIHQNFFRTL
jgi:hypothetical protein